MITIIIPCYNQAEYLKEAIESSLNQTSSCKILVVNDGSTDNSLEIARSYPIKVINQVNKGLSSARNTGIMNADTDYVFFLDADDILKENCIEKIEQKIKETNADIIAPSFHAFGKYNEDCFLQDGLVSKSFAENNRIGYFSAVRRSALLAVGGFSPRMTYGYEDYHLWCDLTKRGYTIATIPEVLVLYRTKEQSMITEAIKHDKELRDQIKKDHPEIYA